MTHGNNDVRELEDLLTELEGQGALPVAPYSEDDDVVTQLMDAPLGEQEWMVQITPLDRRMMSTEQLRAELASRQLVTPDMLVWRPGMGDWAPVADVEELSDGSEAAGEQMPAAPLPPPPVPPARRGAGSTTQPAGRLAAPPPPPPPSVPYGMARPPTPVPESAAMPAGRAPSFGAAPPPAAMASTMVSAMSPAAMSPAAMSSPAGASLATPPPPTPVPPAPGELGAPFNAPSSPMSSRGSSPRMNTQRPVAVDFSEVEAPSRSTPMRALVGSGIAAAVMILGTVYALSAGGVFDSGPAVSAEESAPAAASSKPAEPVAAATPAPAPASTPAEPAPAAEGEPAEAEPQTQRVSAREGDSPMPEVAAASEPEKDDGDDEQEEAASSAADEQAEARDGAEDRSEARMTRAERRQARRLRRMSARTSREPAPRRARPAPAAEPAATEPAVSSRAPEPEEPKAVDPPGSTFNRDAAKAALDSAAAQAANCRPAGGPTGAGRVQVRYEPTGKVGAVSLLTPAFENTTAGSCVVMVFRRASIPAFTGSPAVVMNKSFEIP